jgi:sortase (surface protein transpeptidase)
VAGRTTHTLEMITGRFRLAATAVAVGLLVLAAGCDRPGARYAGTASTVATQGQDGQAEGREAVRGFESVRGYRATPVPVRLEIASIGVSTPLQRLGRASDGTVQVPSEWGVAGWYAGGTRPGDPGSAVILGHVDSRSGPAVFYRLRELRPGDQVEVVQAGGSRVRFTVDRVERHDKQRFPTDDVYYPTLTPRLRLVTCGGAFDPEEGSYRENVIAFAHLSR